jgi:hypothetical protein
VKIRTRDIGYLFRLSFVPGFSHGIRHAACAPLTTMITEREANKELDTGNEQIEPLN